MNRENVTELEGKKKKLPSPLQAAGASSFAFAIGAIVPLLVAVFVKDYRVRLGVVVGAVSLALLGFGGLGAYLGKAPLLKSSLRVLIGGWLAMGITFGVTKLVGVTGLYDEEAQLRALLQKSHMSPSSSHSLMASAHFAGPFTEEATGT
ncbi:hypothetical protein K7X08_036690 [Anisodus acutangulus]|uniref:Vacuolar iron transporter n=1 Tax=Anisodus acutangulus TaxID=402998 RepID=A0A9Q1QV35_9SOLA|nr:hypothetical protein K7X08_036690 [Anisodus acutangulus]